MDGKKRMRQRTMFRTSALSGLGLIVGLLLAACGGGKETTATPVPTATRPPATATLVPAAPTAPAQPTAAPPAATPRPTAPPAPAAPPTASAVTPRYGGVLQLRTQAYPAVWDTWHATGGFTHSFFSNILNNLIRYKYDTVAEVEGDLATDWQLGADGKAYTFRLRQNVTWQDGKPFTSADVAYNLKRGSDPRYTFHAAKVAAIDTIEAPDASTVRVTLKKTNASFIPGIATPWVLMYPAHLTPEQWQASPIGTGAHRFRGAIQNVSFEFAKSPGYFRRDGAGRQLPYLDGLKWTVIADNALTLSAFRAGQILCACSIFDHGWVTTAQDQLRKDIPGVKLGRVGGNFVFLQVNLKRAPFNNLAFRQAVAIGIDKKQLGDALYGPGRARFPHAPNLLVAESGGQWALPTEELSKIPGLNPDHSRDLAIARQKFTESGLDPGRVPAISAIGSFFTSTDTEALASYLITTLGIKVSVASLGTVEADTARRQGNYDLDTEIRGFSFDDPSDWLIPFVSSRGGQNVNGYSNPRVDELLALQEGELDPVKRRAALHEVQRIVLTEFPIIPLYERDSVRGARPEVVGYSPGPILQANFRLDTVWLDR